MIIMMLRQIVKITKRNFHRYRWTSIKKRHYHGYTLDNVISRCEYPHYRSFLKKETIAVLGYGSQGYAQSMNLKDNNINVILGLRKGRSWDRAIMDGWVENLQLKPSCHPLSAQERFDRLRERVCKRQLEIRWPEE